MKLVVAFDSFKGSLSSTEAAEAFTAGWLAVRGDDTITQLSIADGGEGTAEALVAATEGEWRSVVVHDPIGRSIVARYGIAKSSAIVELAEASGLTLLSPDERNPLLTTTYGTGELLHAALNDGYRHIVVGLGGSATNDCGVGLLRALGYRFLDSDGNELRGGGEILGRVATIDDSDRVKALDEATIVVASDVDNPLYGERGAAHIYAPQKGADSAMVEALDSGARHFAEVVARHTGHDHSMTMGAGAAGGVGFALIALLGARLSPGIDIILDAAHFDEEAATADLIITGEGRIDHQSLMGKTISGILGRAKQLGKDIIAIGGQVTDREQLLASGLKAVYAITPEGMPLEEAIKKSTAKENLRRTASLIATMIGV